MEGKETRFGEAASALFAASTTGTSTGAVNSFHSSFSALGGGLAIFHMGLGEVSPGGVGSGVYGILVMAIVTVFVAGLMVGRTPEYLRKKITSREIKLVSLYILTMPVIVLGATGLAMALPGPKKSILNPGPHGLSEVLYAFMSGTNNNGSAFAGLNANTSFYNTGIGLAMLAGRFIPIILALALAGSLARQQPVPATAGTLPTHRPLFVGMLVGVIIIVAGLTFFPALALGPMAEGL
jgi:K+-transporting ATPase ATPase A chain